MINAVVKNPARYAGAAGLALFAAALPLHAQQRTPEAGSDAVIVSAKATSAEQVTTVRELSGDEIRRSGARTLDEAIALLPGVTVRVGGDGTPRIQVRGLQTRHVKILLDGVPLNSSIDGNFDPTLIPVEQIARIKLSAGSSSMLYGDGDLGGVINIITRRGTGPARLDDAGVEFAQGPLRRGWASFSGASGALDYYVSASRLDREAYPLSKSFSATKLEDGGSRLNSDLVRNNLYANLGLAASKDWTLSLIARHTGGEHGIPPSTLPSSDPFATRARYERIENMGNDSVQLTAEHAAGDRWSTKGWFYYNAEAENDNSYDNAQFDSVSDPKLKNTFLLRNKARISGAHLQTSYHGAGRGRLTFALDGRTENWMSSGILHDVPIGGKKFKSRNYSDSRDVGIDSAALEYSVMPRRGTDVTAGWSFYRQRLDGGGGQNASGYLLGFSQALSAATRLRMAYSQHVRFPSIQQLYDPTSGDPTLRRELARNGELGVEHDVSANTKLEAVVFRNDVHNYIEKDNFTNRYQNFDHYRFSGVELSGNTVVAGGLKLRAGYSYLDSKNLSPGAAFAQLQYRPRDKATLEASYASGDGFTVDASALAVSGQYYYSRTSPVQQARLNDFVLFDIKLSKRLRDKHTSLYIGAHNLFDRNYETAYGLPQAGRVLYAGLEYRM